MTVLDWGLTPYSEAVARQLALVDEAVALRGASGGHHPCHKIIFCTHPPVVTVGRGTQQGDVFDWQGEVHEASRGGRATYHGPSQIVVYPIVDLTNRDLHAYMRVLEAAIVATLKKFNIESEARTVKVGPDSPSLTGVWVGDKKIASIGIAVKRGVSYHGLALNVLHDPIAYSGINPCGFRADIMTSVEEVLQSQDERIKSLREKIQLTLQKELMQQLFKKL